MADQPKTIEMRVAELEDKLSKIHVTEDEMKAFQKVSSLMGTQPAAAASGAAGPIPCASSCIASQCVANQCIQQCIVRQCTIIRFCTIIQQCIHQCIIQQCIAECGGGGGGVTGGGGFSGLGG
jgi:hypothetical protein